MYGLSEVVIISSLVFLTSIVLFSFSIGSFKLTRLNINSYIFYKDIILMTFIGTILVASQVDLIFGVRFWAITGDVSEQSRHYGWYSILYFLLVYPIGMMMSNLVFSKSFKSSLFGHYTKKNIVPLFGVGERAFFIAILFFLLLSVLSVFYVYMNMSSIPMIELLNGSSYSDIQVSRTNAKLYFSGSHFIKDMIALKLPILISYILYINEKKQKTRRNKILFWVSFITSVFALTYNFEKAPLFLYVIGFIFVNVMVNGCIQFRVVLGVVIASMGLMVCLFVFLIGHSDIYVALYNFFDRLFVAQTSAIFLSFEYFPGKHEFLSVFSISGVLSQVFGVDNVHYGRIIFEIYDYASVVNKQAGLIVGNFISEAWAIWGGYGVILSPLWVGFFVASISNLIFSLPKNVLFISLYAQIGALISLNGGLSVFINIISFFVPVLQVFVIFSFSFFVQKILDKLVVRQVN